LKDQTLQTKNAEIKLQTLAKANEVLGESNTRLQDNLNEALSKCENLEREINTQKEIMKQMDNSRKDYIQKLKRELETVESRFSQ
jgi:predicted RNase H-like nuclease (RuvC/YqgF family)